MITKIGRCYTSFTYIIIIIWGVSRCRQHSRGYTVVEHKAALKIRHKAEHSQKCKKYRREERDAHWEALSSRKGKTDYVAQINQGIQPRHGKPKGEPDKGRKEGKPHQPLSDSV